MELCRRGISGSSGLICPRGRNKRRDQQHHNYGFHRTPDGSFDPIDAEPSTITNFDGVVGLAYINGTVTRTTIATGEQVDLPFIASDMRIMQGVYRGVDGKPRQGNFALI
jgi:hypothetical protein